MQEVSMRHAAALKAQELEHLDSGGDDDSSGELRTWSLMPHLAMQPLSRHPHEQKLLPAI